MTPSWKGLIVQGSKQEILKLSPLEKLLEKKKERNMHTVTWVSYLYNEQNICNGILIATHLKLSDTMETQTF